MTEKELMMIKRDLQRRARKKGMGKSRTGAYVYGTLRRIRGNPVVNTFDEADMKVVKKAGRVFKGAPEFIVAEIRETGRREIWEIDPQGRGGLKWHGVHYTPASFMRHRRSHTGLKGGFRRIASMRDLPRHLRGNPKSCSEVYDDNWDDREMILVSEKTLKPACIGQKVKSFRGEYAILEGGRAPHKEGSTGKVWVKEEGSTSQREYYPSVYGLAWIPSVNVFPIDKVTQEPRYKLRGNPIRTKIERLREIVSRGQNAVIQGTRVDAYSASAIVSVYDKLDPENKRRYMKMSIPEMADTAFRIITQR